MPDFWKDNELAALRKTVQATETSEFGVVEVTHASDGRIAGTTAGERACLSVILFLVVLVVGVAVLFGQGVIALH